MESFEPKKLALLRILQILQEETDEAHPLTQKEIADRLEKEYGIVIERKAISYNLSLLKEAGYEIESGRGGSYLASHVFSDVELRILIDAVLNSRHITEAYAKDLITRIAKLSNRHFRPGVGHIRSATPQDKTDNRQVFLNIELIDEAIEKGCQISYDYNQIIIPFGLKRETKLIKRAFRRECVSPYTLILHDQQYYLKGYQKDEHGEYMRAENLKNITNLVILEGEPAIPWNTVEKEQADQRTQSVLLRLLSEHGDGESKKIWIELLIYPYVLDEFCDRFGTDCMISKADDLGGIVRVSLLATEECVLQWVMLFQEDVKILSPKPLRERFCRILEDTLEEYKEL